MIDPHESPAAFAARFCRHWTDGVLVGAREELADLVAARDQRVRAEGIWLGTDAILVAVNAALDDDGNPVNCLSRLRALVTASQGRGPWAGER